jgi:hypothetical protein
MGKLRSSRSGNLIGDMTDPRRYSHHEARCSCRTPWALIALLLLVLPLASCGTDNYADRHWDRHDRGNQ